MREICSQIIWVNYVYSSHKNTDDTIYFTLIEGLYTTGPGTGLQCNHEEDSEEYKLIKKKCYAIYKAVKELEELL